MASFTSGPQEKVNKARKMIKEADKLMKTTMLRWSVDPLRAGPLYEKAGAMYGQRHVNSPAHVRTAPLARAGNGGGQRAGGTHARACHVYTSRCVVRGGGV